MHVSHTAMTDSPTLKAIASTILTFAFIVGVGAFTNAIGQNTGPNPEAPAANPYENVESESATAVHNLPGQPAFTTNAAHNTS